MKFLIIGLGSMGRRRIRNLRALGEKKIVGFDIRQSLRKKIEKEFGITTTGNVDSINLDEIDALIISTPPDSHSEWIEFAIDKRKPAFVEASVILKNLEKLNARAKKEKVLITPSCTLRFHPAIKLIKKIVLSNKYGKITNFSYHLGQYLPDWHPWEKVGDSYTGKKETSGVREMVAFELTWLTNIAGKPKQITGLHGKTIDLGVDIDDTYSIALAFDGAYGAMLIDTTSRYAIRNLILNMEKAQLMWRWDQQKVKLYDIDKKLWQELPLPTGKSADGYNENITEEMYEEEIRAFITAVKKEGQFPNSLDDDIGVLKLLNAIK